MPKTITGTVRITIEGFGYATDVELKQAVFDALSEDLQGRYTKDDYVADDKVTVEVIET